MNHPVELTRTAAAPASGYLSGTRAEPLAEQIAAAHEERLLDESLMQTFPASDPISPGFFS